MRVFAELTKANGLLTVYQFSDITIDITKRISLISTDTTRYDTSRCI